MRSMENRARTGRHMATAPKNSARAKFSYCDSLLSKGVNSIIGAVSRQGSLECRKLEKAIRQGDWLATTGLKIDPMAYDSPEQFARDYLAVGLLKKSIHLPITVDRQAEAMSIWMSAEDSCRWVNRNGGIDPFEPNWTSESDNPTLEAVIHTAREKIRRLLGQFHWDDCHSRFGFSSGASTRLPRRNGHPFYKFSGKPEVTRRAAIAALCAIWTVPSWRLSMQEQYGADPYNWVTIVDGSKVTTVGKTAIVDRVIAIEPDMNMFMQRGIGSLIRQRLKVVGVDLNDQSLNQRLALIGSRTGSLATIDLKSASDSISLELVRALLPPDWFDAVDLLRCEVCTLPSGVKHRLEKVSSMGNGFTFELESLIFWALSSATLDLLGTSDKRLGIYGDDIVIHGSAADLLIKVLSRCGFVTNTEKTFSVGPFRESCGKHYFLGTDVTPFYVKQQTDDTTSLYWLANSFRSWVNERGDSSYQRCYNHLVDLCRQASRGKLCYVPEYLGKSAGLICNFDEARPKWDRELQMFVGYRLVPKRLRHVPNGPIAILTWLSCEKHESQLVIEKGDVKYCRESFSTSQWCNTGNTVSL